MAFSLKFARNRSSSSLRHDTTLATAEVPHAGLFAHLLSQAKGAPEILMVALWSTPKPTRLPLWAYQRSWSRL